MKKVAPFFFAILSAVILTGMTSPVLAAEFKEGMHYLPVTPPQPTSSKDKVEVVELFWYGCPHCYRLEPYVNRWLKKKPDNVEFVRMPGVLNPGWELLARAYYTAEILGVVEKVHSPIFDTIHGKRKQLNSQNAIMELFNTLTAQAGERESDGRDPQLVRETVRTMLILLYPMVPHFCSELWQIMDFGTSPEDQSWPVYDADKAREEQLIIVLQVNGKVRSRIEVDAEIEDRELQELALTDDKVGRFIEDKPVKKVIVVKKKLVNIVV